jgi:FkbM family methyltransferase
MNNYDETIYCDRDTMVLSKLEYTPLEITDTVNIYVTDENVDYTQTRYVDKFYFYKNDTIIGQSLRQYGEYTELEIDLLKNFIKPHWAIYDVGANIGYHTVAFAKLGKYVYAFEPNKKNLQLLRKNTKSTENVKIYDVACSNSVGELFVQDFDVTVPGNYGEMLIKDEGQSCKSITIDDLDDVYGPDLLKIDVEGHELQVLRGAIKTIVEFNPVIFYEAHGTELAEIYDLLTDLGYRLYWYPCPNYNPRNYKNNRANIFGMGGVSNILALPKEHKKIANLESVINRDDTLQNAFKRAQEQQK